MGVNVKPSKVGEMVSRQLRLLLVLSRQPRGMSSRKLAGALSCSRATVDRDLAQLRARVGLAIERVRVNGEVWHRLSDLPLSVTLTPAQIAGLALARDLLEPLAGTEAVRALNDLTGDDTPSGVLVRRPGLDGQESVLATLDEALRTGRRLRLQYRSTSRGGEPHEYSLDPITVRIEQGTAYLDAWSLEVDALRTYKVARIDSAECLDEAAEPHSDVDLEEVFRTAVKTWSGPRHEVRIRLSGEVAWLVPEYPLVVHQELLPEEDGTLIVQAEVSGLVEVSRWVLAWGRHAEVLAPESLRDRVHRELAEAAARYEPRPRSRMVSEADGRAHRGSDEIV